MSPKLALLIIGIVLLSHFLRYALGEGAEFLIFIGIAIVSIYAIVRYELTLRFLARVLGSQPNPRQSLVNLENSAVRPDIAWSIDEPAPAVPLRGSRETFGYPKSSYTVLRVIAVFDLVMLALVLIVVARDPSQMGKPLDFAAAILVFGGGGVFLAYCGWGISGIEVTDDYLAAWRGQRRQKLIKWNEVRSVRRTHGGIAVRGGDATIRFSYLIEDYGRLTNLVLTRAAVTGR